MVFLTPFSHGIYLFLRVVNEGLVALLVEDIQLMVSDKASDGHDSIFGQIKASHLAVNPYKGLSGSRFRHFVGRWRVFLLQILLD